jgi:hypothetical protein
MVHARLTMLKSELERCAGGKVRDVFTWHTAHRQGRSASIAPATRSELNSLLDSVAPVEVVDPGTVWRAQCEKPYGDRGCAAYSS